MAKRTKQREESIRQLLAELKLSGQSVAAFARRREVSAWTLYGWRRRFGLAGAKPKSQPGRRRSGGHDRPSLVAVKVTDPRQDESVFEVTVGTIRVTVPLGFDEVELARLLKVVASC